MFNVILFFKVIKTIITTEMTTCICGILKNSQTGMICLWHFDVCNDHCLNNLDEIFKQMSVKDSLTDEFELTFIGGYNDEQNISNKLIVNLLDLFNNLPFTINLVYIFTGTRNTVLEDDIFKPIVTGIKIIIDGLNYSFQSINLKNSYSEINESNLVPMYFIRQMHITFGIFGEYLSIYDWQKQMMIIPPLEFACYIFSTEFKKRIERIVQLSDQEFLNVNLFLLFFNKCFYLIINF